MTVIFIPDYYGVTDQYWPDSEQSLSPEGRVGPAFQRSNAGGQQQQPPLQPQQQPPIGNVNNLQRNGSNMLNPSHVMSNPPPTPPRKHKNNEGHQRPLQKDIGTETENSGYVSNMNCRIF